MTQQQEGRVQLQFELSATKVVHSKGNFRLPVYCFQTPEWFSSKVVVCNQGIISFRHEASKQTNFRF